MDNSKNYIKTFAKISFKIITVLSIISLLPVCYRKEHLRQQYTDYCNRSFLQKSIYGQSQECELYKLQLNAMENNCMVGDVGMLRQTWTKLSNLNFFPKIQSYVNHMFGY